MDKERRVDKTSSVGRRKEVNIVSRAKVSVTVITVTEIAQNFKMFG